jgi:hypothetical protein
VPRWLGTLIVGSVFLLLAAAASWSWCRRWSTRASTSSPTCPRSPRPCGCASSSSATPSAKRLGPEDAAKLEEFFTAMSAPSPAGRRAGGRHRRQRPRHLQRLSLVFITPIVGFYILRDWHHILASLDLNVPESHRPQITASRWRSTCGWPVPARAGGGVRRSAPSTPSG